MNLHPLTESNTPIYQQIIDHIKTMILNNELLVGDPLPSIRALAKDLQVSVITTRRAYQELEKDGFILTVPSKGSFVADQDMDKIREEYRSRIEVHMREIMVLSEFCGLNEHELAMMFHLLRVQEGIIQ